MAHELLDLVLHPEAWIFKQRASDMEFFKAQRCLSLVKTEEEEQNDVLPHHGLVGQSPSPIPQEAKLLLGGALHTWPKGVD